MICRRFRTPDRHTAGEASCGRSSGCNDGWEAYPRRLKLFLLLLIGFASFSGCLPSLDERLQKQPIDPPAVTLKEEALVELIDTTLKNNLEQRILTADRNAAWQVFHGAVAYGQDLPIEANDQVVFALEYLFRGGTLRGWVPTVGDEIAPGRRGLKLPVEEGSFTGQGHVDQFLGYISQVKVPRETKILVKGIEITIEDWARQAQRDISNNPYLEYSWTLIALTNYFPDDKEWTAADGRRWTLEPFVEHEASQNLTTSACGGMHRLMGLAHALKYRQRLRLPLQGGYQLAQSVVETAIANAKAFQNSDGSFSTKYTQRPSNSADLSSCLSATGHTLEFLAFALSDDAIKEPWMERAVSRLCKMLDSAKDIDLECGGIYHALAGLRLYRERRFGSL
jgi:hypothetical protein